MIPNELVVMLKEGKTLDSFAKSIKDKEIKIIGHISDIRIVQIEEPAARREERKGKRHGTD